jgi:hypothetical protein
VREYARYLGLSAEDVVNRYNFAAAGDDRIEKSIHLERLTTLPPPREVPKKGIPTWWAIKAKGPQRNDGEATETIAAASQPAPQPQPEPAAAPAPPPKDNKLHLIIEVRQDSFINLEADGKRLFNDVMRAGERQTYDAEQEFRFRTIGNAGGLILYLNDNRLPPLGEEGEVVRNRTFNRETLMRLNEPAGGSD